MPGSTTLDENFFTQRKAIKVEASLASHPPSLHQTTHYRQLFGYTNKERKKKGKNYELI